MAWGGSSREGSEGTYYLLHKECDWRRGGGPMDWRRISQRMLCQHLIENVRRGQGEAQGCKGLESLLLLAIRHHSTGTYGVTAMTRLSRCDL